MPPTIAAIAFAIGIFGLYWLERDPENRTSPAIWIPIVWLVIASSRMVSQWTMIEARLDSPDQYLDGSAFDRAIFMTLLAGALIVLLARLGRTAELLRRNWPILVFFLYCLISTLWSDYPFVSFKRWTKGVGNAAMIMVVLTDPKPAAAVRRFLSSAAFLLVPISVLLIKYFPQYGRGYLSWIWTTIYVGVSNTKNGLGYDCLISGLASFWCLTQSYYYDRETIWRRRCVAHGAILLMVFWLFSLANSATSLACFGIGIVFIVIATSSIGRRPAVVHLMIATILVGVAIAYTFFDFQSMVLEGFGRDSSLSGRTELWTELSRMAKAPWFGTGFESFWLGDRAEYLWQKYWWHPNQAHNGYFETYLNLGWVGIGFLVFMIAFGYRTAVASSRDDPQTRPIRLAFFVVAVVYNLTEAAYKAIHPVWIVFMLASTASPRAISAQVASTVALVRSRRELLRPVASLRPSIAAQPARAAVHRIAPVRRLERR